jgi:hypothetical protein
MSRDKRAPMHLPFTNPYISIKISKPKLFLKTHYFWFKIVGSLNLLPFYGSINSSAHAKFLL